MGIQQSSMSCVDDTKKCSLTSYKPYKEYAKYVKSIPDSDPDKQKKINSYVCDNKNGSVTQCCDKNSMSANDIVTNAKLIKIIPNKEYQICSRCSTTECENKNCVGFKKPTNYELCKARSIDPNKIIPEVYIDRILESSVYPDCYPMCQTTLNPTKVIEGFTEPTLINKSYPNMVLDQAVEIRYSNVK